MRSEDVLSSADPDVGGRTGCTAGPDTDPLFGATSSGHTADHVVGQLVVRAKCQGSSTTPCDLASGTLR
jgi:hypothetical protein